MNTQPLSSPILVARGAREVVAPFLNELGSLNEEAALIAVARALPRVTQADARELLARAAGVQAALERMEGQLASALAERSSEVAQHGRVRDVKSAIASARKRLE